jgi:hypothetical protein
MAVNRFGDWTHNKRLTRLNRRARAKVSMQWSLYCVVQSIEKLSKTILGYQGLQ